MSNIRVSTTNSAIWSSTEATTTKSHTKEAATLLEILAIGSAIIVAIMTSAATNYIPMLSIVCHFHSGKLGMQTSARRAGSVIEPSKHPPPPSTPPPPHTQHTHPHTIRRVVHRVVSSIVSLSHTLHLFFLSVNVFILESSLDVLNGVAASSVFYQALVYIKLGPLPDY